MTSTAPETEPTTEEGTKPSPEATSEAAAPPQFTHFAPLPPPPPGFVATRWSGPAYGGGPAAWLSALIGGVAAAVALPLTKPGIGWFLVGLVIAITVASAARYGPKPDEAIERYIRIGWVVLALALLAVGTYLNAYWLFYICVLGALGCALRVVRGEIVVGP